MYLIVLCLFTATLFAGSIRAQENEAPKMFYVIEEFVAPSQTTEFWKIQTEALEVFDELNLKMTFSCFRTNQNSYYWIVPIESFASIDKLFAQVMANNKALMENGYNPSKKFRELSTMNTSVVIWNKDLSYNADPVNDEAPANSFHKWVFLYLEAGHEKEAEEALKAYQKYYDGIEDSYTWNIYQLALGNNLPCWILHQSAVSEIAMLQHNKALTEKYGADFKKLWNEFKSHVRDSETVKGWSIPKWSRGGESE